MPDPDRVLRQRSALAEFALTSLGALDSITVAEAALVAVQAGLGLEHSAVYERKSFGLDLVACAQWSSGEGLSSDPPAAALRALGLHAPHPFEEGDSHGVAVQVDTDPVRLLVAMTSDASASLSDVDLLFAADVAAILRGGLIRTSTMRALRASEDRARDSEARAHAILNTTVDGIVTIDTRGCIESFNPAAEDIFGYRAAEVVGQNVSILMPPYYASHHDGYMKAYLDTGHQRIIGTGREVLGQRRDGSTFPMDLAVSEVVVPGYRMFTGIIRDISSRRHLEREVVRVIEDERRILGQEMHDDLGQRLSGVGLVARELANRAAEAESAFADDIAEVADLVQETDAHARALSRGLVLTEVGDEPLGDAIEHMVQRASKLFSVPGRFDASGTPAPLADLTKTHLYRIAQEAFTNAAIHAEPSEVHIHLDWVEHGVRLVVTDDGIGIPGVSDGPVQANERRGMGLKTMHFRARLLGGRLTLEPVSGQGTQVICVVPHEYAAPADLDLDLDTLRSE